MIKKTFWLFTITFILFNTISFADYFSETYWVNNKNNPTIIYNYDSTNSKLTKVTSNNFEKIKTPNTKNIKFYTCWKDTSWLSCIYENDRKVGDLINNFEFETYGIINDYLSKNKIWDYLYFDKNKDYTCTSADTSCLNVNISNDLVKSIKITWDTTIKDQNLNLLIIDVENNNDATINFDNSKIKNLYIYTTNSENKITLTWTINNLKKLNLRWDVEFDLTNFDIPNIVDYEILAKKITNNKLMKNSTNTLKSIIITNSYSNTIDLKWFIWLELIKTYYDIGEIPVNLIFDKNNLPTNLQYWFNGNTEINKNSDKTTLPLDSNSNIELTWDWNKININIVNKNSNIKIYDENFKNCIENDSYDKNRKRVSISFTEHTDDNNKYWTIDQDQDTLDSIENLWDCSDVISLNWIENLKNLKTLIIYSLKKWFDENSLTKIWDKLENFSITYNARNQISNIDTILEKPNLKNVSLNYTAIKTIDMSKFSPSIEEFSINGNWTDITFQNNTDSNKTYNLSSFQIIWNNWKINFKGDQETFKNFSKLKTLALGAWQISDTKLKLNNLNSDDVTLINIPLSELKNNTFYTFEYYNDEITNFDDTTIEWNTIDNLTLNTPKLSLITETNWNWFWASRLWYSTNLDDGFISLYYHDHTTIIHLPIIKTNSDDTKPSKYIKLNDLQVEWLWDVNKNPFEISNILAYSMRPRERNGRSEVISTNNKIIAPAIFKNSDWKYIYYDDNVNFKYVKIYDFEKNSNYLWLWNFWIQNLDIENQNWKKIPQELWNIKWLDTLTLYYWDKNDSDFSELKDLTNLKELNVNYGQNTQITFKNIWQLSNLEKLNLNHFNIWDIPDDSELWDLTNLKDLELTNDAITKIGTFIQNLTNLEIFDAFNNEITEVADLTNSNLEDIDLSNNKIKTFPKIKSSHIKTVDAYCWDSYDWDSVCITRNNLQNIDNAINLIKNDNVTRVSFAHNDLSLLPDNITDLDWLLTELDFSDNNLWNLNRSFFRKDSTTYTETIIDSDNDWKADTNLTIKGDWDHVKIYK